MLIQFIILNMFLIEILTYYSYDIYLDDEHILQKTNLLPASVNDLIFHHSSNHSVINLNN